MTLPGWGPPSPGPLRSTFITGIGPLDLGVPSLEGPFWDRFFGEIPGHVVETWPKPVQDLARRGPKRGSKMAHFWTPFLTPFFQVLSGRVQFERDL